MKVKDKLIEQINRIENEDLMNSISSMISILNHNGVFEIDESLGEELEMRSKKISDGEFKTHEEIVKKYNK